MIPKEDLEKITQEAIISSGRCIIQNFENSIIIMNKIVDDLYIIINDPKYKDQIEAFMLAKAYNGKSFVDLSLDGDVVCMDYFSEVCDIKTLYISKNDLQNLSNNVLAYLNIQRFSNDCYYCESGLEVNTSSFLKKFSFYGYELQIRVGFNGLFNFTVRW